MFLRTVWLTTSLTLGAGLAPPAGAQNISSKALPNLTESSHRVGKFEKSPQAPQWQMLAQFVRQQGQTPGDLRADLHSSSVVSSPASSADTQNFESFRAKVQPIFLKQRAGHARCYACHSQQNRILALAPLSPGKTDWSAEQ